MSCGGRWVMAPCNPTNPMASEIAKEKCPISFRLIDGLYLRRREVFLQFGNLRRTFAQCASVEKSTAYER